VELLLSHVPDAEQRQWRTLMRGKVQLIQDRVRLGNQLEALLEEARIKLSSVISELLGLSGRRILEAMRQHAEAVIRLAEVPGFGPDSAQQLIAEVGPTAMAFPSAGQLASWIGVCPGTQKSAEHNHSSRSPKGNHFARRILRQAAQAAVKKKGSSFQRLFRRFLPRLDFTGAIWVVAHRLCRLVWKILRQGVHYIEQGELGSAKARNDRTRKMIKELRRLGYTVLPASAEPQPTG